VRVRTLEFHWPVKRLVIDVYVQHKVHAESQIMRPSIVMDNKKVGYRNMVVGWYLAVTLEIMGFCPSFGNIIELQSFLHAVSGIGGLKIVCVTVQEKQRSVSSVVINSKKLSCYQDGQV